jgi:hypothetical protein
MLSLLLTCSLFLFWAILGRAILAVFIPRMLGVLRPWLLAPTVGFATLAIPIAFLNQQGLPIKSFAWYLTVGLFIFAIIGLKLKRTIFPTKVLIPFIGVLLFSLLWTAWPALRFDFNWVSVVNDDYCNYCLAAERFKDFGFYHIPTRYDLVGHDYAQYYWFMHAIGLMRFGSEHALAWVASLVPLPALEIFMPTIMGFALAQICAAAGLVLMAGLRRSYAFWTAVLLAISPMFLFGTVYQLIAQVSGVSLLLTLIVLLTAHINTRKRWILFWYAIPVSLVGAALGLFYPEVSPFAILAICLYHCVKWFRTRSFPGIQIVLIQYSILGSIILMRYNFISYLYTLGNQFAGASRKVDLSLSMFPFFMVPTGLSSIFGFQPMMVDISEPWGSLIIILGLLLLIVSIFYAIKASYRIVPVAILLCVELLMAAWLYRSGNDFGLYKIIMFMQPVLMAALASVVLESRLRKYIALITLLYFGLTAYTSLYYTRGSCGSNSGMITEVSHASEFFAHRPSLPDSKAHWTSTIDNVTAAKLAAGLYRSTDLTFLSRDNFLNFLIITPEFPYLKLFPNYSQFALAIAMVDYRQTNDYLNKTIFGTQFVEIQDNRTPDSYLTQASALSLFNKIHQNSDQKGELFSVESQKSVHNRLVFIHSSRGNQYYLGDRHKISYFQQEHDYYSETTGFNGVGQFMLLRIENPSPQIYLRVSATKSVMGSGNNTWSTEASILGKDTAKLGATGSGALNLIAGPITPFVLDGASYIALDFNQPAIAMPYSRHGLKALYNSKINLDYRRLVAYGRDISALSPEEVRSIERPRGLGNFPVDMVKAKGLEYSGIYEDGWISSDSLFTFAAAESNDQIRIKGFIPEIPGITQNETLTIRVNKTSQYQVVCSPGAFDWALPVSSTTRVTSLELHSSAHAQLPAPDLRPVTAHLTYIGLESKGVYTYDYSNADSARPLASHIGSDGWAGQNAEITIPVSTATHSLILKIEYPGWEGIAKYVNLTIHDQQNNAIRTVLNQGMNVIRVPCNVGLSKITLRLETNVSFTLPAPDLRRCAFRLVSLTPLQIK